VNESGGPTKQNDIATGVIALIDAALGVGTALTKSVAAATANGNPVKEPPPGTAPIPVMIHYSLAVVTNIASLVTDAVKGASARRTTSTAGPSDGAGPRVRAGATLRVPLSIENPSDRPMKGLAPLVRAVRRDGKDASADLPPKTVSFAPATLNVAPRDFEKLTVFVAVPEGAHAGRYEITLALGPREADLPLVLEVTDGAVA
jgi:hypothetical protein